MSKRINVQLEDRYVAKLEALAERTHGQPGTLARSLLSTALDQAEPDPRGIVELLDRIPGAFERYEEGLAQAERGEGVSLDDF